MMIARIVRNLKIKNKLLFIFDKYKEQFSKTDLPYFINDGIELVEYGEYAIALENFCSNLYEFNIKIFQEDLEIIKECATLMKLKEETWNFIETI